jgi:hypothetical protein
MRALRELSPRDSMEAMKERIRKEGIDDGATGRPITTPRVLDSAPLDKCGRI